MVLCPKCGTQNPRDVEECVYCGVSLLSADTGPAANPNPGRSCGIGCAAAVAAGLASMAFYAAFLAISAAASLSLASYAVRAFLSTRKNEPHLRPAVDRPGSGRPTVGTLTTVVTVLCCLSAINTIWLSALGAYGAYVLPAFRFNAVVMPWIGRSLPPSILFLLVGLVIWADARGGRALRPAAIALTMTAFLGVISFLAQPFERKAVSSARKIECLSHVKHLVIGISMYLQDNDGRFPGESWDSRIRVLDQNDLKCPEAPGLACAYAENGALRGVKVNSLSDPAATIMVFESDKGPHAIGGPALLTKEPRHFGGDNIGFADGHAQWVSRQALFADQSHFRWKPK